MNLDVFHANPPSTFRLEVFQSLPSSIGHCSVQQSLFSSVNHCQSSREVELDVQNLEIRVPWLRNRSEKVRYLWKSSDFSADKILFERNSNLRKFLLSWCVKKPSLCWYRALKPSFWVQKPSTHQAAQGKPRKFLQNTPLPVKTHKSWHISLTLFFPSRSG